MAPYLPADSDGTQRSEEDGDQPNITVLVTGFGPFQAQYPVNPSFEVTKALPTVLPKTLSGDAAINIVSYPSPLRVAYADTQKLLPELLAAHADSIDLVLHIGMASGRTYYAAEKYAHTRGYTRHKDIDGHFGASPADDNDNDSGPSLPDRLTTSLAFDALIARWRDAVRDIPTGEPGHAADVRPSEDAGSFLCDYTYCTSMKWFARRNHCVDGGGPRARPVLFFHVPAASDTATLETGGAVAQSLIRAMARELVEKRDKE
nr:pyroglutamyl-peptidase 1-like [Quercus suber]POE83817.1 pyroglutamyl-peptidase 1 [Quercus suber]